MRNGCHIHPNISPRSGVPVVVSVFLDLCVCRGGVHNDVLNFETCLHRLEIVWRCLKMVEWRDKSIFAHRNVLDSVFLQHVRKVFSHVIHQSTVSSLCRGNSPSFACWFRMRETNVKCHENTWNNIHQRYIKDTSNSLSNSWLSINHSCCQYNHPYSQIITEKNCFARAETQKLCSWPTTSLARATCWASTLKRRRCTKLSKNGRFYVLDRSYRDLSAIGLLYQWWVL